MIYFCADDYGLSEEPSLHIREGLEKGVLNKVSIFPNFEKVNIEEISKIKDVRLSLHINLVEGKCMADGLRLIADGRGNFTCTFGGLMRLSLIRKKQFEEEVFREIRAQVVYWKSILPAGTPFCVDSHQHTHMIPSVFRALLRVLSDEKISPEYVRIPSEPLIAYIKTPSLYFTYKPVNLIKQWVLKLLWLVNKGQAKKHKIPYSHFMGILFSGHMDEKRVLRVLDKYIKLSQKDGNDIEVLFHPGYMNTFDFFNKNIAFGKFYMSENRKTEYDSVMNISERSVL